MAIKQQSGFTLIELILVMAITGGLAVIAFQGQAQLRSRAQFDAFVEKALSSIDNAHNQATAGVNFTGNGNGASNCTGAPAPAGIRYIFAGVNWSAVNGSPTVIQMDFFAAQLKLSDLTRTGASPCIFNTETLRLIPGLTVTSPPASATRRISFVRNDTGGLEICRSTAALNSLKQTFGLGSCRAPATVITSPGFQFRLGDADGHYADILVDPSGLAKRLN